MVAKSKLSRLSTTGNLHIFPPPVPGHAAFHQAAQRREFLGKVPALERSGLIQRIDLLLDQRQVMDGIEDNVFPVPAPRITGNDLATAAEHHLIDIAPNPDVLMAVGDRHGIVLGLVADERLGRHNSAGLVAGVKRRRRQGTHGIQVSLKPFADCLAPAPQLVALAFAVLLFQKDIERIPCQKLRDRPYEVARGVADKALDIPFVVAFARTPIAIPDQVVGQEAAEQRRPLACSVGRDPGHKATVIVIEDRLWHGPEEGERVDVAIDPGLGYRRRIGPHVAAVTMRQIQHEEARLLLDSADDHRRLTEVGLCMAGRMSQRHEHFLPALVPLAHIILDDRVAAGEPARVTQPVEHPLGRMTLLARHLNVRFEPMLDRRHKGVHLRPTHRRLTPVAAGVE